LFNYCTAIYEICRNKGAKAQGRKGVKAQKREGPPGGQGCGKGGDKEAQGRKGRMAQRRKGARAKPARKT